MYRNKRVIYRNRKTCLMKGSEKSRQSLLDVKMENIQYYRDSKGKLIATVIPNTYKSEGIEFITHNSSLAQVAVMSHKMGHRIIPHYHNTVGRLVDYTCETLIIRVGILEVNLYENMKLCYSFRISKGDILTLYGGGHGFNVIEDVDMIEIKQGPYVGDKDKTRFEPLD